MATLFSRWLLTTLLFSALLFRLDAQLRPEGTDSNVQKIKLKNISIDDGLSQGNVYSVLQDKTGYLWIATADGLNRYDGYDFVVYRNQLDSQSIASNYIKRLFEDSKSRLWISFIEGGLDLFDKSSGKFIHVIPIENRPITSDPGGFSFLGSYGDGILILRNRNVYSVNLDTLTVKSTTQNKDSVFFRPRIRQLMEKKNGAKFIWGSTPDIYVTARNRIWMYDLSHSLFELKIDSVTNQYQFLEHTVPSHLIQTNRVRQNPFFYAVDNFNGKLYFQQYSNIYRLDERTDSIELFMKNTAVESYLANAVDRYGNIWINNLGRLYFLNVAERKGRYIESTDQEIQKKNESTTGACYSDRMGNIWVCTRGYGLMKINLRSGAFHHARRKSGINFSTRRINRTLNGNFYVIPWEGEYCLFDTTEIELQPIPILFTESGPKKNGRDLASYLFVPGTTTIPAHILNPGNYFLQIEANNKGLYVVEPQKDFIANIYSEKKEAVMGPYLLAPGHTVWFAAEGKSLRSLNLLTGEYRSFPVPAEAGHIRETIARDVKGNIWLATEQGVCAYDITTGKWRTYLHNTNGGLLPGNILCFFFETGESQHAWIGFEGRGFCKMDINTGTCQYFTTDNGLPNNVVYGILQDWAGALWISTNRGLSAFNMKSKQFRNFTSEDGLQSNEFNRYSFGQTLSGAILFGGVKGITYFKGPAIRSPLSGAEIWLTDMFVNNEAVTPDDPYLRFSAFGKNAGITLNHDQNVIAFHFALSDLTAPQQNKFSYKLEGIDQNWSPMSTEHNAVYTYLPPGDYVFRVKGINRDGFEARNQISFPFTIKAPWWQTWWFKTLVVLAILAFAYGLYRYRLNQVLRLHAIRNRISADMHDEIGSTLSSISFYSQALLMQNPDEKQKAVLEKIKDNAQDVQEGLSDIVWSVKADMDSFDNLLIRMQRIGIELLEPKNIAFHFEGDEQLKHYKTNMVARKNFYLIFKETLHNAAKYAQCDNVWVTIKVNKQNIVMTIKDDGKGFDMQNKRNGNGLGNMQQRAIAMKGELIIQSQPGQGTDVTLFLKTRT